LRGEKTIVELAKLHDVRPHQITGWKNELLERAAEIFGGATGGADPAADREKIQELR
jgi:transposase